MKIKATAPFETTDKNAVTAMGEPSYTSAVHKWKGTMESLKANAVNKNTKAKTCKGDPSSKPGSSLKLTVPVAPYNKEIPNNKIPEEKAEDKIIFMAPSEERFLSKSKLAIAATGIVASSNDR